MRARWYRYKGTALKLETGHFIGIGAVILLLLAFALLMAGVRNIAGFPMAGAGDFATGYLAAGNFSVGVFAAGMFAAGIFAAGIFAIGIFSIGIFSIGIFSLGTFAISIYALMKMLRKD